MTQKRKQYKVCFGIFLVILSLILSGSLMQETATKCIIGFVVIATVVIAMVKGLEINGMSDIFAVFLLEAAPAFIRFFSDIPFIDKVAGAYTKAAGFIYMWIGKDTTINISNEMSVTITVILIIFIFELWNCKKDRTAMKILHKSQDEGLKEKSFTEKSEMFCRTLCQWLEEINRETNWNETQFTPLEAEVEMEIGGKRKKKYEDLIKCLKKNRRHGTVYLVLGSPGSGKSVSMRKLCLDLLKESKKAQKIPVYINLKEWNEEWDLDRMPTMKDLIIFIRKTFEAKADFLTESFLTEYFQRMLEDGRWYFIFDSFDEMPCLMGKKNSQELIDGISALLYQLMTGPNQSGGVVASRLYKAPSSAVGATVTLKIQEFSDIKIKTMLKKYLIHSEEAIKLLFDGREDLVALCRNPFYLALLCDYISDRGTVLPENQMKLYHSFIDSRLKKCAGKLEKEDMNENDIYQAAKKLASFMQETEECGLECPTKLLYQQGDEVYWRKVFSLLKYAKICRLGGQEEMISFVHRRFQEFFLVENIIDEKQEIGYESYRDILSDAGMRDALVLYCEVAEEEKAKEIANFCWKTIEANMKYAGSIHTKESQELVCVLYFMKEAFRNRKQVLSDFNNDFHELVKKMLDEDKKDRDKKTDSKSDYIDYILVLALVNTMVLFSKTQLKELVLTVFKKHNRWLNDIVAQNCRSLDRLDYHIENAFVRYFGHMDIRIFLRRFSDIHFSLSVSEKFKYIRKMHVMIMLLNINFVLIIVLFCGTIVIKLFDFFLQGSISEISAMSNIFSYDNLNISHENSTLYFDASFKVIAIVIVFVIVFVPVFTLLYTRITRFLNIHITGISVIGLCLMPFYKSALGTLSVAALIIYMLLFILFAMLLYTHDIKFYYKNKKLARSALKGIGKILRSNLLEFFIYLAAISIALVISSLSPAIFAVIMLAVVGIFFAALLLMTVYYGMRYLKDCMWLKKHSVEMNHMQRTLLESNLESIRFNRIKHKYLQRLILQNVELKGAWSDNIRPQYGDDRVDHTLAKLDCMKLESCDYLF